MERARLKLALQRLEPKDWGRFETFASEFLVTDHPNLRTVASPSGDSGRDAELFSPEAIPSIVFQYSVSTGWRRKIYQTAKRVEKTLPEARLLVYVTNQNILADADKVKKNVLRNYNLVLDIYDQSWFLDRFKGDPRREAVSETLAKFSADPYLAGEGVFRRSSLALTPTEYRAALVHLQLQWEDDTREKGLTKLAFEAIVRAILRETNSASRLSRAHIHTAVKDMLPSHDPQRLEALTDSALARLTKRFIRHWKKEDEFCLTFAESERMKDRLADIEAENLDLDSEIRVILTKQLVEEVDDVDQIERYCELVRSTLDHYLLSRGELFASAVSAGRLNRLGFDDLNDIVDKCVAQAKLPKKSSGHANDLMLSTIQELVLNPSEVVQSQLRSKADTYTLFAFLRETPDVQSAVSKMFTGGAIWVDTNIVLPLFAEELLPLEHRRFTGMLNAAREAGLSLLVTPGVVEEVERHMNRCLTFARVQGRDWHDRVPFLSAAHIQCGRATGAFPHWVERFCGPERPEDDIADYLEEYHGILSEGLEDEANRAPAQLYAAVQEVWHRAHTKRRGESEADIDEHTINRLVRHDVENYLGVVQRRSGEKRNLVGYTSWWLTLDRVAFQVETEIKRDFGRDTPPSPVMSPDFLINYFTIGPVRARVSKSTERSLPLMLDVGLVDELTPELVAEAERIRADAEGLDEHVIRRRVRDHLDSAKKRLGTVARRGVEVILEDLAAYGRQNDH